ncbi:MAG TPA: aminotransferase class V-fold PLP-dependent enzyme, partial [Saprospiraceae bacterium]|nr:aminotransferase class V-fold PLP-dependent enzyme [Saprospiraceae bacterium]
MLKNQKDLFLLPDDVTYLNGAFMSPLLKSSVEIGHQALLQKSTPFQISQSDFFDIPKRLKQSFAELVDIPDYRNVAIIPSVSYGIANVTNNITLKKGKEIVLIKDQFSSHVYAWRELAKNQGGKIITVNPPDSFVNRGKQWNQKILDAINENTAVVAISILLWTDGTRFDIAAIRDKTKHFGAQLILDGTQAIGVMPFSVREIQPDALIVGGYKWLMGPYSTGVAYYSDEFCDEGKPIEENWINRANSQDFSNLSHYQDEYQPKAGRFSVGESSNFALNPMLNDGIRQLIRWQPARIQDYCKNISTKAIDS